MRHPARMSDSEFLEVFVPPEHLLPALAELVNEALGPYARELSAKRGNLVRVDNVLDLDPDVVMTAMNWARGRLGLPVFPNREQYGRYQRLREARVGE